MTCVCWVCVVSTVVTLQLYGPVSVTLTLWMVRMLTASVAWNRALRWGLVSSQLFGWWDEMKFRCLFTDTVKHVTNCCCYVPLCGGKPTECPPQRWTPPSPCSSGWGPPLLSARLAPQETAWHRKPDFLSRKEKKGGGRNRGTEGGETVREVTVTSSAVFPSSQDQRKWLSFGPEETSYYKEAVRHKLALFPFMCQAIY